MSWAATAGSASLNISGPMGALESASSLLWDWDKLFPPINSALQPVGPKMRQAFDVKGQYNTNLEKREQDINRCKTGGIDKILLTSPSKTVNMYIQRKRLTI